MPTISVKWLNGDIQPVEVDEGTPVYRVILQLGLTLLETTFLSESGNRIEHYYVFTRAELVHILVHPPPTTIIVYNGCGVDYYVSTADCFRHPKRFTPEVSYDKAYVDILSYGFHLSLEQKQEVCDRLNLVTTSFCCSHILQLVHIEDTPVRIGWQEFTRRIVMARKEQDLLFPTVTESMKANAMLTPKEWMSYKVN